MTGVFLVTVTYAYRSKHIPVQRVTSLSQGDNEWIKGYAGAVDTLCEIFVIARDCDTEFLCKTAGKTPSTICISHFLNKT